MHRLSYRLLILFTVLATLGGLLTLLPRAAASYPNLIGYSSLCTFAPAATFYCFFLAGLSCVIRATFVKGEDEVPWQEYRRSDLDTGSRCHLHCQVPEYQNFLRRHRDIGNHRVIGGLYESKKYH
jgi:hypothetical protein